MYGQVATCPAEQTWSSNYHNKKKAPGNPEALNYIKCQKPEANS
jgi:hypothetical protein